MERLRKSLLLVLLFSSLVGASVLSLFSIFQKSIIGANPFLLKGFIVPIGIGGLVGMLAGYWRYRLIGSMAATRASEVRYRGLFNAAPDCVVIVDERGRCLSLNPHAACFYPELKEGEAVTPVLMSQEQLGALFGRFAEGEIEDIKCSLERGGELHDIWRRVAMVAWSGHRRLLIYDRDETSRRALEQQLTQAQKMEAIGHLAGGMAHDFNNLLAVILGHSELLMEELESSALLEDLAPIRDAATRGARLTQQLLALSRRQALNLEPLELNRLVRRMSTMLRRVTSEKIEQKNALNEAPLYVTGDPGLLEQALLNLVLNARDAMVEGGGEISITTARVELAGRRVPLEIDDDTAYWVSLEVRDDGVGMSEEVVERIFEPFFSTKAKGHSGLGLAMVFGIIRQHGGWVEVESALGAGTTFRILLPGRDLDEAWVPGERSTGLVRAPASLKTALVVEDEDAVRLLIVGLLERLGLEVKAAGNGKLALEMLKKERPDVVISDVVMPVLGGVDLYLEMRQQGLKIPFLFVTGYVPEGERVFLDLDVPLLRKPFTLEDFVAALREVGSEGG